MSYRATIFSNNQYYHIFNRGVEKRTVFLDKRDYDRFIETMVYYQEIKPLCRFSFKKRDIFLNSPPVKSNKQVEIISYILMPSHFHFILQQISNNGIPNFISKLENSYTKYFNTRHKRIGPLFQGNFKAKRVEDDEQLLHLSRYIHLNPLTDYLVKDLKRYVYSSYPEFLDVSENNICNKEVILSLFKTKAKYEKFVLDQEDYGRKIKEIERLISLE